MSSFLCALTTDKKSSFFPQPESFFALCKSLHNLCNLVKYGFLFPHPAFTHQFNCKYRKSNDDSISVKAQNDFIVTSSSCHDRAQESKMAEKV
jgi:hypothetical protein